MASRHALMAARALGLMHTQVGEGSTGTKKGLDREAWEKDRKKRKEAKKARKRSRR